MATQKQIVTAVGALIETVTIANGYAIDLAGKVSVNKNKKLSKSEPVGVVVQRGTKSIPEGAEYGHNRREIEVDVTVEARGTGAGDTVLAAIEDIEKALNADKKLGGLARWTTIEHGSPDSDEASEDFTGQVLTIVVGFIEN